MEINNDTVKLMNELFDNINNDSFMQIINRCANSKPNEETCEKIKENLKKRDKHELIKFNSIVNSTISKHRSLTAGGYIFIAKCLPEEHISNILIYKIIETHRYSGTPRKDLESVLDSLLLKDHPIFDDQQTIFKLLQYFPEYVDFRPQLIKNIDITLVIKVIEADAVNLFNHLYDQKISIDNRSLSCAISHNSVKCFMRLLELGCSLTENNFNDIFKTKPITGHYYDKVIYIEAIKKTKDRFRDDMVRILNSMINSHPEILIENDFIKIDKHNTDYRRYDRYSCTDISEILDSCCENGMETIYNNINIFLLITKYIPAKSCRNPIDDTIKKHCISAGFIPFDINFYRFNINDLKKICKNYKNTSGIYTVVEFIKAGIMPTSDCFENLCMAKHNHQLHKCVQLFLDIGFKPTRTCLRNASFSNIPIIGNLCSALDKDMNVEHNKKVEQILKDYVKEGNDTCNFENIKMYVKKRLYEKEEKEEKEDTVIKNKNKSKRKITVLFDKEKEYKNIKKRDKQNITPKMRLFFDNNEEKVSFIDVRKRIIKYIKDNRLADNESIKIDKKLGSALNIREGFYFKYSDMDKIVSRFFEE